jgi:hypothetical protein
MATLGGLLPPIGLEIPCSMYAVDMQWTISGSFKLDMKGGIRYRVEGFHRDGLGGVKLKIIGFEVSADHDVLGKVTMSQGDIDTDPLSVLELTSDKPPSFVQTTMVTGSLSIEKPPEGDGPMRLISTSPFTIRNEKLTVFPPQGSVFKNVGTLDFTSDGARTSSVQAILEQCAFTMSHNP